MAQELTGKRLPSGRRRVTEAAVCGIVAGAIAAWLLPWQLVVLIAWDVAAATELLRVWFHVGRMDGAETRLHATREDNSRTGAGLLLITAGTVSLVGVAFAFVEANSTTEVMGVVLRAAGVLTIALSWGVIHTVFALRYANLYYSDPVGGIDFKDKGTEEPDYRDFAYTAFTIGMTFQVSDTDITTHKIRRTALRHALLSFLFGAVILATTINVIASLLND